MLPQDTMTIPRRQDAAHKWAANYAEKNRNHQEQDETKRALAVIALDVRIYNWLAEHDPMALKQCQEALDGTSWENYR
jgi:hypothetical protein